jgi:hypothetical protein
VKVDIQVKKREVKEAEKQALFNPCETTYLTLWNEENGIQSAKWESLDGKLAEHKHVVQAFWRKYEKE